ncbi:DUF721 domain-containing protein [Muricoccus pecuniae]|uniref:DUF721 domain-containing protein n=1 Tax=Muricoccus pecuniae TaxID=693023 RepID=A0A840YDN8_9PROT|nr:DUF721 domain-containing protein [Roseomonas pecuniae]MBB5692023.1 hypothetical protein [Roseomonas pecuniae]
MPPGHDASLGQQGSPARAASPRRRQPAAHNKEAEAPAAPPAMIDPRRPDLGLRPLGGFIPRLTRPAFKKRSPAGALLMADWAGIVGPAIAAVTVPKRLTGGTLTIGCSGPVAMELQHLAPQLIGRVNAALGSVTVESLRFVQQAPSAAAAPRARPAAPLPDTVRGALDTVGNPELRDALARLARGVYRAR